MTTLHAGLTPVFYDSIDAVPPDQLAALTQGARLYDSPAWLQYCERAPGASYTYVGMTADDGTLVGLVALRFVDDPATMSLYNVGSLLEGQDQVPPVLYPNLLGAVSGAHCALLTARTAGPEREQLLRALVSSTAEAAQRQGCQTYGFLYLRAADAAVVADELGTTSFIVDANTALDAGWPDFESYVHTLSGSSRTKRKRERRRFLESGLTVEVSSGVSMLGTETAELQLQLRRKYGLGGSIEQILRDYRALGDTVADHLRVFVCRRDDAAVGMSMGLVDAGTLHIRLSGFDYERVDRDFVYFNMTFYEPIEWGIASSIESFTFGTGTYAAKKERGCRLVPSYGAVRWAPGVREQAGAAVAARSERLIRELELDVEQSDD